MSLSRRRILLSVSLAEQCHIVLEVMFGYTTRGSLVNGVHVDDLVPLEARGRHFLHRADYAVAPSTRPMGLGLNAHGQRLDGTTFPIAVSLYSEVIAGVTCVVFTVMSLVDGDATKKQANSLLSIPRP